MHEFNSIHVQGFRRLHDVKLNLKALNVMIGANGCGKTSLLDMFSLLCASASGDLEQTMTDLGGVNQNLTALTEVDKGQSQSLRFELDKAVLVGEPLKYQIEFRPNGTSYQIINESLTQQRDPDKPQPHKYVETNYGNIRYFDPKQTKLLPPDSEHLPL